MWCQVINYCSPANGMWGRAAGSGGLAAMRGMMEVEYRAAVRMVAAPDFIEGVRCSAQKPVDCPTHLMSVLARLR